MTFTPNEKKQILETVFPDYCDTIGPKNLKKICQDQNLEIAKTEHGSNMMFGQIITTLMSATDFLNNALSVYMILAQKDRKPQTIVHKTVNIINIGDSASMSEEAQLKLAELVLKYGDGKEQ